MLERYESELELIGISNLDSLKEDGSFSKLIINDKENYEPGYIGVVSINENNKAEIIFVLHDKDERILVCDNYKGTFIQAKLSLLENRDPVTLFDEYCKEPNLFLKIQELNRFKYYLMNKSKVPKEDRINRILKVDEEISELQDKLNIKRAM